MADKKKAAVESAAPAADKKKALETAMAQIENCLLYTSDAADE